MGQTMPKSAINKLRTIEKNQPEVQAGLESNILRLQVRHPEFLTLACTNKNHVTPSYLSLNSKEFSMSLGHSKEGGVDLYKKCFKLPLSSMCTSII